MSDIQLTPEDMTLIKAMAVHRTAVSPNEQGIPLRSEIVGLKGECAFSHMTGYSLLWNFTNPTDDRPDFIDQGGVTIDVKTASKKGSEALLVTSWNKTPPGADIIVWMEIVSGSKVRFVGWAATQDVCIDKYWTPNDPNLKRPCWMFPRKKARKWDEE